MLLLAVARRVSEYGITESRYVVAVLGAWLTLVSIYFLASRTQDIRVFPATLCALALLTSFGPWGAFAVSERSQVARLRRLLEANHVLVGGAFHKPERAPSSEDLKRINAEVRYLSDAHGLSALAGWLAGGAPGARRAIADSLARDSGREKAVRAMAMMGLPYMDAWQGRSSADFEFAVDQQAPIPIGGYDQLFPSHYFAAARPEDRTATASQTHEFQTGGTRYALVWLPDSCAMTVRRLGLSPAAIRFDLAPRIRAVLEEGHHPAYLPNVPLEQVTLEDSTFDLRARLYVLSAHGSSEGATPWLDRIMVDVLVAPRRP